MTGTDIRVHYRDRRVRVETFRGRDGYYWRLVARNGRTLAIGEAHPTRAKALRAIRRVIVLLDTIPSGAVQ